MFSLKDDGLPLNELATSIRDCRDRRMNNPAVNGPVARVDWLEMSNIDEVTKHSGRRRHRRADKVRSAAGTLAAFEVAVAG
jgi:hypothetical protein